MRLKKLVDNNFVKISKQPNQKMQMYKCKSCTQSYAHHVTRMAEHLHQRCRGCPQEIKDQIRRTVKPKLAKCHGKKSHHRSRSGYSSASDSSSEVDTDIDLNAGMDARQEDDIPTQGTSNQTAVTVKPKTSSIEQSRIKTFCDTMNKKDISEAQKLLAKAIYVSGTPLSMTENPYWKDFFTYLRPAFPVPTRRQISEKFLEDIYAEVKSEVDKKVISAGCVGLQCDGWSNVRNEGIVNIILTTPDPIFFKSVPTGTNSETSTYIAAELSKVIDEVGASKVLGICTDNASVMKAAWRILEEQYGKNNIVFYGCVAHILNLLIKDVMKLPTVDKLTKNVKSIVKEIKQSHLLSAKFTALQGKDPNGVKTTLKLPVITRWGSLVTCLQSIFVNKHNLQALAIDQTVSKQLNRLTKSVLLEEEFWILVQKVLHLVEPVAAWIRSLEGDTPKLSCVSEAFLEIERHFETELKSAALSPLPSRESDAAIAAVKSRCTMAIRPVHLAANILDPSYKGKNLTERDHTSGTELIHQLAEKFGLDIAKVLSELAEYNADEGLWAQPYVQKASSSTACSTWWKGICHKTALSKLAQELLNLPPTSAATERSFSTHGWIHNSKRNRLSVRRAGMIAYISYNMRLFKGSRPKKETKIQAQASVQMSDSSAMSEEEECEEAEDVKEAEECEDAEESAVDTEYQDEEYLLEDLVFPLTPGGL